MEIKCSDYLIVKLRYYADAKVLKKHYADPNHADKWLPKQHHERAVAYHDFFFSFIEKITGKSKDYWYYQYMTDASACLREEIHETYGILTSDTGGYYVWMIPKNRKDLFDWVVENTTVPYKVMKKVHLGGWKWRGPEASTYSREFSKLHTQRMKEKFPFLKKEQYEQE